MGGSRELSRALLEDLSETLHLGCSPSEIDELMRAIPRLLSDIDTTRECWSAAVDAPAPRVDRPFHAPSDEEDPFRAWTVRCAIQESRSGPLAGCTIAVKDSIPVAGLPLANGSRVLEGYIAARDAEVVARVLRAGGTIVGKARCEDFCLSGGSHTGHGGPVLNPVSPRHTSGGSSSGGAVAVASGDADMGIGGDQGGSVRIPSSFCGVVGLKPTWGKIPYAGAMSIEPSVDHLGTIARTVADNLRLFDVLSGQGRSQDVRDDLTNAGVADVKIGLLKEGFAQPTAEPGVDDLVRNAVDALARGGADVLEVSVPEHSRASAIWTAIGLEGVRRVMIDGEGVGDSSVGAYATDLVRYLHEAKTRLSSAALRTREFILAAAIVHAWYGSEPYAMSRQAATALRDKYGSAFGMVDVLAMPTTPHTASLLPTDGGLAGSDFAAESMAGNTVPFNLTHHPALSVPCGSLNGLPVGLMLVGRHDEEDLLFRVAARAERVLAGFPLA